MEPVKRKDIIIIGLLFTNIIFSCFLSYEIFSIKKDSGIGYARIYDVAVSNKIKAINEKSNAAIRNYADSIKKDSEGKSSQELAAMRKEFREKLHKMESEKLKNRNYVLKEAADKVAAKRNIKVILTDNCILSGSVDVTDDLLKELDG